MNAKSKTLFCFIVMLSFGHFVRATHKNPALTGSVLRVVKVQGEIDPHLLHIRRERQFTATSGGYPWEMRPQIYGFTAPPEGDRIWFPAEFDPTAEIILGWPSYAFDTDGRLKILELREIVRHSLGITKVSIILQNRTKPFVEETLRAAKLDPDKVEMITFNEEFPDNGPWSTLDTVWMRDYGPQFVYGSSPVNRMNLHVIDTSYYPRHWASKSNPAGRVRDDAAPTRLAALRGLFSYRPRLIAEGGDFMTDGAGTCFVSDRLPLANRIILGSTNEWKESLARFYGCRRIIVLKGLKGEPTGHLDMFMTVLSPTTIFVGKYNAAHDSVNAERLDKNSHILMASGYKVTRIPMPAPYSIAFSRIWATFTNIVRINGRILVPVYRNPNFPASLRAIIRKQEAEALRKFRETLPGVSVIPVAADSLIPAGGSLHCIVVNLPRRNFEKQ